MKVCEDKTNSGLADLQGHVLEAWPGFSTQFSFDGNQRRNPWPAEREVVPFQTSTYHTKSASRLVVSTVQISKPLGYLILETDRP